MPAIHAILSVEAAASLFYFALRGEAGILHSIACYFPQMLILIFMLPGVAAFFLTGVLNAKGAANLKVKEDSNPNRKAGVFR